jgi:hypothetical protein
VRPCPEEEDVEGYTKDIIIAKPSASFSIKIGRCRLTLSNPSCDRPELGA